MKNYHYLIVPLLMLSAFGCKNSSTSGLDLGTYRGNVTLLDVAAKPLPQSDGATVAVEGTPFRATTNAHGDWQMDGIPAGIYNLIFSKPGFDSIYFTGDEFSGAGTSFIEGIGMISIPSDSVICTINVIRGVDSISSGGDTNHGPWHIDITGRITGNDPIPYILATYATDSISAWTNPYYLQNTDPQIPMASDRTFHARFEKWNLQQMASGSVIYIGVIATAMQNFSGYNQNIHWGTGYRLASRPWSPNAHIQRIVIP